jgi:hypothetical protein
VNPRTIKSTAELLDAIRSRKDELDISNATAEGIIGLPSGYLSKVIALKPIKGLSPAMFRDLLDGLALGIVAIVIDENLEQAELMRPRWVRRRRPPTRGFGALLACSSLLLSMIARGQPNVERPINLRAC